MNDLDGRRDFETMALRTCYLQCREEGGGFFGGREEGSAVVWLEFLSETP